MRFKLLIEYDGTRYAGWQLQKNERTIQGELLQAAIKAFKTEAVEIYGAGRTDAGVHARGQVAHLEAPTTHPPLTIQQWFNDKLPPDIHVVKVEKAASPKFHARHDAKLRTYVYQISKRRDAFSKRHVWWVKDPLAVEKMREAARLFVGFRDFSSFGDADPNEKSTLVDLRECSIRETEDRIFITIAGSHFRWKMVRRMVGALVEVGRGKLAVEAIKDAMAAKTTDLKKFTAPPSGLFLEKVDY